MQGSRTYGIFLIVFANLAMLALTITLFYISTYYAAGVIVAWIVLGLPILGAFLQHRRGMREMERLAREEDVDS